MVSENEVSDNPVFGHLRVKGQEMTKAVLRDDRGHRREVVLIDIQDPSIEHLLLDANVQPELRADIATALRTFSPLEQRIIVRVLVQGQSVEEACKRSRKSTRTWRRWFETTAIPRLQNLLSAYAEEIRRIGKYNPELVTEEITPEPEETCKCRFCPETFIGKRAFAKLRQHVLDSHKADFVRAQNYVSANDYVIARDAQQLAEAPLPVGAVEEDGQ